MALGGKVDPAVQALCEEFGITIIGTANYPKPGQTRAPGTIGRIRAKHGEEHTRLVLSTLSETSGGATLDETSLWAASDLVRVCRNIVERDTSAWLAFWDRVPVADLQFMVQDLYGQVSPRKALVGMIYERVVAHFGRFAGCREIGPYADPVKVELRDAA